MADVDERFPVDDAGVDAGLLRFLLQQVVPFAPRRQRRIERRRRVVAARRGARQRARVVEREARGGARPRRGALERGAQARADVSRVAA